MVPGVYDRSTCSYCVDDLIDQIHLESRQHTKVACMCLHAPIVVVSEGDELPKGSACLYENADHNIDLYLIQEYLTLTKNLIMTYNRLS